MTDCGLKQTDPAVIACFAAAKAADAQGATQEAADTFNAALGVNTGSATVGPHGSPRDILAPAPPPPSPSPSPPPIPPVSLLPPAASPPVPRDVEAHAHHPAPVPPLVPLPAHLTSVPPAPTFVSKPTLVPAPVPGAPGPHGRAFNNVKANAPVPQVKKPIPPPVVPVPGSKPSEIKTEPVLPPPQVEKTGARPPKIPARAPMASDPAAHAHAHGRAIHDVGSRFDPAPTPGLVPPPSPLVHPPPPLSSGVVPAPSPDLAHHKAPPADSRGPGGLKFFLDTWSRSLRGFSDSSAEH